MYMVWILAADVLGPSGWYVARAQESSCTPYALASQTQMINVVCCDEPSEDCTGGAPAVCNVGCAELFLPFMQSCGSVLGEHLTDFEPVVALCEAAVGGAPLAAPRRWVASGIGGGGSFYDPSLHPTVPGEIFVTSDMSGVYHSSDAGESFEMSYAGMITGGPGCRVQFAPIPSWVFTLDKNYDGGSLACSLDSGSTWVSPEGR